MMEITVNGEARQVEGASRLDALLSELGIDPSRIVVELNGAIVERGLFGETSISAGDRIEIVRFVGGG